MVAGLKGKLFSTLVFAAAFAAPALAQVTTWSTEFKVDGGLYRKDYAQDDATFSTTETLYVLNAGGTWSFVAMLYTDGATSDWTGQIGNAYYADQYDETLGDWVVVVGYKIWPTWSDFEAALTALHFWDDTVLVYDGGIYGGDILVLAVADSGSIGEVSTTEAMPKQKGLLTALSKATKPTARVALLTALNNPTPHETFPALATKGKGSPRAAWKPKP